MTPVPPQLIPRLAAAALCTAVLAGCGSPPQPLPTSAPQIPSSVEPSSALPPLGALPVVPTTVPPVATVPPYPTYPTLTTPTTVPTTATTPPPAPAALCTGGPSKAQILAVVAGKPGIPDDQLEVSSGPFCSGGWQFAELRIKGKDDDEEDPLLVVTKGKPASLTLLEAGGDVCSDTVQSDAPPGIRVRACGF
jgi:hypothetical protein